MIDLALNHEEDVVQKLKSTWFKEKYKFYSFADYYDIIELEKSTWKEHQLVSLNSNGEVIGFISYNIDRSCNSVTNFALVNFSGKENNITFGVDTLVAVREIFEKFKFRKMNFEVIIGNPAERHYDRIINKYGGRIVGIKLEDIKLFDGSYYDTKLYEISKESYDLARGFYHDCAEGRIRSSNE
ncbi:MAG: hypothetical protein LBT06_10780 [Hungatella sp.]|nr:hypothetical protein [Hungatella sp.]